jgi:hypothetical protein
MSSGPIHAWRWVTITSATLTLAGTTLVAGDAQAWRSGAALTHPGSPPTTETKQPIAQLSRTLSVNDTGHLHLLKAFGAVLLEEGPVTGTLPGRTRVRMVVGASVTATFTIKARGGSIEGRGSAVLHSSSRYASFGGSLSVNHGTGRYAHAHGNGKLYGVIDRRTDALTVQTTGKLSY